MMIRWMTNADREALPFARENKGNMATIGPLARRLTTYTEGGLLSRMPRAMWEWLRYQRVALQYGIRYAPSAPRSLYAMTEADARAAASQLGHLKGTFSDNDVDMAVLAAARWHRAILATGDKALIKDALGVNHMDVLFRVFVGTEVQRAQAYAKFTMMINEIRKRNTNIPTAVDITGRP